MSTRIATILFVIAGSIAFFVPLQAQNVRHVDAGGNDTGNDCLNAAAPCKTIGHALTSSSAGDTLDVAAGVYTETFTIATDIVLRGEDEATTIIQAHPLPNTAMSRVITISGQPDVRISDLTVRHGQLASGVGQGAGMYCNGATLVLENVTFTLNRVSGFNVSEAGGGGLYLLSGDNVMLTNVTFSENTAINKHGGGMYNTGGSPTLTDVTFVGNVSNSGRGAGLYNENGSPILNNVIFEGNGESGKGHGGGMYNFQGSPVLTNVVFNGNLAENAGGMLNDGDTVLSTPVLSGVTFSGNSSIRGGGMINDNGSSPTLDDVKFVGNAASQLSGGMVNRNFSSPVLRNVMFESNTSNFAGSGAGMFNDNHSNPTLFNVVFVGNTGLTTSNFTVGGMKNEDSSSPTLVNVTFSGNSGHIAGALYNQFDCTPTLTNVIMWNNAHGQGSDGPTASIWNGDNSSRPLISYSLIQNSGGSGGWVTAVGVDGGNNLDEDPLFVEASGKGWSISAADLRLTSASPAVNTGDPDTDLASFPTDEGANPIDLDGNPRTHGAGIDIGAYEFQGSAVAVEDDGFELPLDAVAYPNPVVTRATIQYELERPTRVNLAIYDAIGRRLNILVEGNQNAGRNAVSFDATGLPSGTYFYRLETKNGAGRTGKLVVLR